MLAAEDADAETSCPDPHLGILLSEKELVEQNSTGGSCAVLNPDAMLRRS